MSSSPMDCNSIQPNGTTEPPLPPIPINAENRIEELETLLVDNNRKDDHTNIRKVIGMYRQGELPDRTRPLVIIQNGEVIALDELVPQGPPYWIEGYLVGRMQAANQNPGVSHPSSYSVGAGFAPTLDSETYPFNPATQSHEISINVRFPGSLIYMTTQMINDTGSNALNLFYHEAYTLASGVPVPLHQVFVGTADGVVRRNTTAFEIQIIGRNGAPLTEWMLEIAALIHPPGERLSGESMRSRLYFATAPRTYHQSLYVSRTKTGLMRIMPGLR